MLTVLLCCSFVSATNAGFTTTQLQPDTAESVLTNMELSFLTEEPMKQAFSCFDVSENGSFAIGTESSSYRTVCIYSPDGRFQYGYRFRSYGTFGIELEGNILRIFLVRSDIVLSLDPYGQVIHIAEVENTSENNSRWTYILYTNRRNIGDRKYIAGNGNRLLNILTSNYGKLTLQASDGIETIVYDAGYGHLIRNAVIVIAFVLIGIVCVYGAINRIQQDEMLHPPQKGS